MLKGLTCSLCIFRRPGAGSGQDVELCKKSLGKSPVLVEYLQKKHRDHCRSSGRRTSSRGVIFSKRLRSEQGQKVDEINALCSKR